MELLDQIIALLKTKFSGAREDVIQNLASVIALQVEDKAGAQGIVDRLTADKVQQFGTSYRSRIDREVQQGTKAFEENLKKKFDLVEKTVQKDPNAGTGGGLTIEAIQAAMAAQLAPLTQRMDAYENQQVGASRRDSYVAKMKEAKLDESMQATLLQQFDRMAFKDDADFNQFLTDSQPTFAKMAQDAANTRLRNDGAPSFGSVDEKGVSQGMKSYLENKGKVDPRGEGKALF